MGHLTLISEDVIIALERFPPDLRLLISKYAPDPEWDEYVHGRYHETKERDMSLLGGGKPAIVPGARAVGRWKVDEEDPNTLNTPALAVNGHEGVKGEFRRTSSARPTREGSADFGSAMDDDDDDAAPHVSVYLLSLRSWY